MLERGYRFVIGGTGEALGLVRVIGRLERMKGIEPLRAIWKIGALPLSYIRVGQ